MRRLLSLLGVLPFLIPSTAQADVLVPGYAESSIRRYVEVIGTPLPPLIVPGSGTGAGFVAPAGATFGPDGFLYVSCQVSVFSPGAPDFVMRVNPSNGQFAPFLMLPTGYVPAGLRFGTDGNLYVARNAGQGSGASDGRIDRYNGVSGMFIDSPVMNLHQPTMIQFRGTELFISNFGAGNVIRFDGVTSSQFNVGGSLASPSGLAFGPGGDLYVADLLVGAVRRFDGVTGVAEADLVPPSVGGPLENQFPADLLFDRFGSQLLVANLGASFVPGDPPNLHGNVRGFDPITGAYDGEFASDILGASALVLTPIPEPTSLLLGGCGAMAIWRLRRKQK